MIRRLSQSVLKELPSNIAVPDYDRAQLQAGICHIGVGAFHRGHQAVYCDRLLSNGDARWGIRGASLRSARVADQLNPQNGLYTLLERDGDEETARVIGALLDVIVAPQAPDALIDALAHPATQLVTMTITEKGYCLDPATGSLRVDDAELANDIKGTRPPVTALGFLLAGLKARRKAGAGEVTILSCDNIPNNGARTRSAVLAFAAQVDPGSVGWIEDHVSFPSSMVDRIVPATTEADIDQLAVRLGGIRDEAMIKTEPFSQWVVEDNFAGVRPDLDSVGVQMTKDVAPWETSKLRMLNGAHSAIAYLGGLSGYEYVHCAMAKSEFDLFVSRLWDELQTTLNPVAGLDIAAYRKSLKARFLNSALMHRTRQIAMDGSQKLPQRLLEPLKIRTESGKTSPSILLAIAGWMHWQTGRNEQESRFEVEDPLSEQTCRIARQHSENPEELVSAFLQLHQVFAPWVSENACTVRALVDAYRSIKELGVAETLRRAL